MKNKEIKSVTLQNFWDSLGDGAVNKRQSLVLRAERMRAICEDANFNYSGLKLVMQNHRRLGMQSASRLHEAAKRWAVNNGFEFQIDFNDLVAIACRTEVRDTRKTHLSKY